MEFLKILWDNLKKGPVTDAFPFGETYTPDRLRGRVEIDPALCVGCGTCVHVCAAGAINISKFEDGSGFEITVWRNSCCLCAQCRHYCPTKAVTLTNDWHSAHRATEKYTQITRAKVKYDYCAVCGAKMRVLPQEVLNRIYAKHSEVDVDVISHLCPNCRRIDVAVEEDRACHIDPRGSLSRSAEKGRKGLGGQGKRKGSSRSGGLCPENSRTLAGSYGTAQVRPCGFQGGAERPDASG